MTIPVIGTPAHGSNALCYDNQGSQFRVYAHSNNSQFYVVYNTLSLCIAIHDFSLRIHVHVLCMVPLLYVYKF